MRSIFVFLLIPFWVNCQIAVKQSISTLENAGQSNSNGIELVANFPVLFRGVHSSTKIFYPTFDSNWNILNAGVNNSGAGRSGIDVILGDSLQIYTGKTTFIVKNPENGKGLFPSYSGEDFNTANEGKLITRNIQSLYNASVSMAQDSQKNMAVKFIVIIHGESDAQHFFAAKNYATNLTAFINKRRLELRNPTLPVVIVKLNNVIPILDYPYFNTIRAAQISVSSTLSNVTLLDNDDVTMMPDGIHYDAAANIRVGSRIFNLMKTTF